MESTQTSWHLQQYKNPTDLNAAIPYLHRAAQFIAIAGNSLLQPEPDDSHTSMKWMTKEKMLVGQVLPLDQQVRLGLHYEKFELLLLTSDLQPLAFLPLTGQTESQVMGWLRNVLDRVGAASKQIQPITHYELPPHPLAEGDIFQVVKPIYHQEAIRYRSNANLALEQATEEYKEHKPICVWPHHFDTGVLVPVQLDQQKNTVRFVLAGLAIPDNTVGEFYYYVRPVDKSEQADMGDLPILSAGKWLNNSLPMAIITASEIVRSKQADEQEKTVHKFLQSAIRGSVQLLSNQ